MSEEVVEKKKKVKKPKSKARKIIEWVFLGIFMAICAVILAGQIEGMVNAKKHYGQTLRFGYATFVVKTDSMEPEMPVKSAIITKYESATSLYNSFTKKQQAGKTIDEIRLDITFMDIVRIDLHPSDTTHIYETNPTGYPMTHRVFEIQVRENVKVGNGRFVFFASGINDQSLEWRKEQYQTFTEKEMLGTVKVRSTFLGGVFGVISSPIGLLIFLMIPAFYLVITSVLDIFKAYKEDDEPKAVTEGASSDSNSGETTNQENETQNGEENTDVLANLSEEERKRLKEELLQEMINKRGSNNE